MPHPGPAVLDGMKAHYDDLHLALKRLDRPLGGEAGVSSKSATTRAGFDALGESERLNARRDLTAALSAYREKRYADFARLGGSHWARHAALNPTAAVAGDRSGVIRTGEARPDSIFKLNR